MKLKLANQLRNTFHTLFSMSEPQVFFVAIRKTYQSLDIDDWEVCLYGKTEHSAFLLPLATLGYTLDGMIPELHAGMGTYDAGTTDKDERTCITIH